MRTPINITRLSDTSVETPGQERLGLSLRQPMLDVVRGVDLMGSDEALLEILETVNTSLRAAIPDIWSALEVDDVSQANHLLHCIRGYAPILCSDPLIDQIAQVELASKTESCAHVIALFSELAPRLDALLVEIQTYMSTQSSRRS